VHDRLGTRWIIGLIVAGAGLSALLSPRLAVASGTAFLLSELLDFSVYAPTAAAAVAPRRGAVQLDGVDAGLRGVSQPYLRLARVPARADRWQSVGLAPTPAPHKPYPTFLNSFFEGLRERGWVEGQNVAFEFREGPDLQANATELVRLKVDVIVALSTPHRRGQGGHSDDSHCVCGHRHGRTRARCQSRASQREPHGLRLG
jgi:hypothetical protein